MKKVFLFLLVMLISAASLNAQSQTGSVNGVVTYYFNKYKGDVPDLAAKVYFIPYDSTTYVKNILNFQTRKLNKLLQRETDTTGQSEAERNAYITLLNCEYSPKIKKTNVDATGSFKKELKIGRYFVVVQSKGRDCINSGNWMNMVELHGCIDFKIINITEEEPNADISINFSM